MASPSTFSQFDDIFDFLSSTPTPEQIIHYEPPAILQERLSGLLERNRLDQLNREEKDELEEFLRLNRFMMRLKLRARLKLPAA